MTNEILKNIEGNLIDCNTVVIEKKEMFTHCPVNLVLKVTCLTDMCFIKASSVLHGDSDKIQDIVNDLNKNPKTGLYHFSEEDQKLELLTTIWIDKTPTTAKLKNITDAITSELGVTCMMISYMERNLNG